MEPFVSFNQDRTQNFDVNHKLLHFLDSLNKKIHSLSVGSDFSSLKNSNSCKIFLVIGPVRSGTTYLLQQIMQSENFFVPSNFLSRFYSNLPFGAALQRLLTDQNLTLKEMDDIIQLSANMNPSLEVILERLLEYLTHIQFGTSGNSN